MTPPAWCEQYVGKPFAEKGRGPEGFDCWGLVREIQQARHSRALPDYADAYTATTDKHSVSSVAERGIRECGWISVPVPHEGDIIILRLAGRPWHCAYYVGGGWMLHVVHGANACLERIDSWVWRNHIEGYYTCLS